MIFGQWLKGLANLITNALQLSNATPIGDGQPAAVGTGIRAARDDHAHPRLYAVATGTLNGSGEATVTFARSYPSKPGYSITYEELTDNQPVNLKIKSWVTDGSGNYTGATVKGYRGQTLPASIVLLSVLVSFNVNGGSATGVSFSLLTQAP